MQEQGRLSGCRTPAWEGRVAGLLLRRPRPRPHRLCPQWEENLLGGAAWTPLASLPWFGLAVFALQSRWVFSL